MKEYTAQQNRLATAKLTPQDLATLARLKKLSPNSWCAARYYESMYEKPVDGTIYDDEPEGLEQTFNKWELEDSVVDNGTDRVSQVQELLAQAKAREEKEVAEKKKAKLDYDTFVRNLGLEPEGDD